MALDANNKMFVMYIVIWKQKKIFMNLEKPA